MIETMRWYIIQIDSMVGTQRVHHQFPKSLWSRPAKRYIIRRLSKLPCGYMTS
jgi:hypothetical protein